MTQATALHIGLNRIDPVFYTTEGRLAGCVNDAMAMNDLSTKAGFQSTTLLNEKATCRAIFNNIIDAARVLKSGDILLVTFSGHGTQTEDENGDEAPGRFDQTWCAYDRPLVDDELAELWAMFPAGVRIVLISDSCHSATIARQLELLARVRSQSRDAATLRGIDDLRPGLDENVVFRTLPLEFQARVLRDNRELFSNIQQQTRGNKNVKIGATVITLAACLDTEVTLDGDQNGLFTSKLLQVWNGGSFLGNYAEFLKQIASLIGSGQHPQYKVDGKPNLSFQAERPFTITAGPIPTPNPNPSPDPYPNPGPVGNNGDCRMELTIPRKLIDALKSGETLSLSVGVRPY